MQIQARLPETKIYVMSYYPVNRELPGADPEAVKAQFGARTNAELKEVNAEVEKNGRGARLHIHQCVRLSAG